jgi:hypothetical protein
MHLASWPLQRSHGIYCLVSFCPFRNHAHACTSPWKNPWFPDSQVIRSPYCYTIFIKVSPLVWHCTNKLAYISPLLCHGHKYAPCMVINPGTFWVHDLLSDSSETEHLLHGQYLLSCWYRCSSLRLPLYSLGEWHTGEGGERDGSERGLSSFVSPMKRKELIMNRFLIFAWFIGEFSTILFSFLVPSCSCCRSVSNQLLNYQRRL